MNKIRRLLTVCMVLTTCGLLLPSCGSDEDRITAAFDAEFHTRPDGYKGLTAHYGFEFPRMPKQMDPGLMYRAVNQGAVDVINAFATDGRIEAYDLCVLEDDQGFFPPYYAAPLLRNDLLDKHPEIKGVLNALAGRIDSDTMRKLNYQVDELGEKAPNVARQFLEAEGLLAQNAEKGSGDAGAITIGGKQFTEQEILSEMMALLIEHKTDLRVRRKLNLGGTMICFNALRSGDLDLYPEYTGTGLVTILKEDVIRNPDAVYERVAIAFGEEYHMIWLEPFGFNNTYTLTMRCQHAQQLGIETISDLAAELSQAGS